MAKHERICSDRLFIERSCYDRKTVPEKRKIEADEDDETDAKKSKAQGSDRWDDVSSDQISLNSQQQFSCFVGRRRRKFSGSSDDRPEETSRKFDCDHSLPTHDEIPTRSSSKGAPSEGTCNRGKAEERGADRRRWVGLNDQIFNEIFYIFVWRSTWRAKKNKQKLQAKILPTHLLLYVIIEKIAKNCISHLHLATVVKIESK